MPLFYSINQNLFSKFVVILSHRLHRFLTFRRTVHNNKQLWAFPPSLFITGWLFSLSTPCSLFPTCCVCITSVAFLLYYVGLCCILPLLVNGNFVTGWMSFLALTLIFNFVKSSYMGGKRWRGTSHPNERMVNLFQWMNRHKMQEE